MKKVGVVGYSKQEFDKASAAVFLLDAFIFLRERYEEILVISGLTDLGIPSIAYHLANALGQKTSGIACAKAEQYKCYPCDFIRIVGSNWGDESKDFLQEIDILIRVGGGKQSMAETKAAKELGIECIEKDL